MPIEFDDKIFTSPPDKDFEVITRKDINPINQRITELEKAVEGLYDLIEELAKKI